MPPKLTVDVGEPPAGADDDDLEVAFSDCSSVVDEDYDKSVSISRRLGPPLRHAIKASNKEANPKATLGRRAMKERFNAKEEERRKVVEGMKRAEEERKQRDLEALRAYEERLANGGADADTESEAASGLSDSEGEAAGALPVLDGPSLQPVEDSDTESGAARGNQSRPSNTSELGTEGDSEPDVLESSKVVIKADDSTRIELQIQGTADGSQDGPPRRVVVRLRGDWAPIGAARFMELVEAGFYKGARFHRVVKGTLVQFGLPPDPAIYAEWKTKLLPDDTEGCRVRNSRGTISFAANGKGTRCCQVFVNLGMHKSFDIQGFVPFAEVVQGMSVMDELFGDYGELPPKGTGPNPESIKEQGLKYLNTFPKLSWIASAEVISRSGDADCGLKKRPSLKQARDDTDGGDGDEVRRTTSRVSFSAETPSEHWSKMTPRRPPSPPAGKKNGSPGGQRVASPAGSGYSAIKALKRSSSK